MVRSLSLIAFAFLAGCAGSRGDSVPSSDDALHGSLGPAFSCAADFSSTGDAITISGNFKSRDDATKYARAEVEIATERDGWVGKYEVKNGSVDDGGGNTSKKLLEGYARDGKLELKPSQKLADMNCFNVTTNSRNVTAEVHICLAKSAGTHDPTGFAVSDLVGGNSFDAVDCR